MEQSTASSSKRTPKLRFPEFQDAPEWKDQKLKLLLDSISNGLTLDQVDDKSGYKVTRIETISDRCINLEKVGYVLSDQNLADFKLQTGNILFSNINSLSHIGKNVLIDRDYDLYHGMNLLRLVVNEDKCDPRIIYYLLNTSQIRESIRQRSNKAVNQASINQTEVGRTVVGLPDLNEQQRIADCLSSLDEWIAAEAKRLDALKDHKKGLMQQLFPSEGETTPKLRFPEFQDAPEWKENLLGDICETTTGRLDANAMVAGGRYRFYTCAKDYYQIDEYAFDTDALLISGNGANVGYIHHYNGKFNAYQRTYVLDQFTENITFIKNLLDSSLRHRIVLEKKDGNTPYIVRSTLTEMKIFLPCEKEQQAIADCLSSLDEWITAQSDRLGALKEYKQGLMQQLFPSSKEGNA